MLRSLVGSEMCIRDRSRTVQRLSHFLFTRECLAQNLCSDNFTTQYEYTEYDVCYDQTFLVEIATSLKLNTTYYDFDSRMVKTEGNIEIIISYLNQDFINLLSAILFEPGKSHHDPLLIIIKDNVTFPHLYDSKQHPNVAYKPSSSILEVIAMFGWEKLGLVLINFGKHSNIYTEQFENIISEIKTLDNICYFHKTINNEQDFKETALKISREDYNIPKILYGTPKNQQRFIEATQAVWRYNYHKWVVTNTKYDFFATLSILLRQTIVLIIDKHYKTRKAFTRYRHLYPNMEYFGIPEMPGFPNSENKLLFEKLMVILVSIKIKLIDKTYPALNLRTYFKKFGETKISVYAAPLDVIFDGVDTVHPFLTGNETLKSLLFESKCLYVTCGPGRYKQFGKKNQMKWDTEYGYRCLKCPKNHVKPLKGDSLCYPCTSFHIANDLRTHCYDPYIDTFLNFNMFTVKTCTITSLSIATMVVFVMVMLIVYRKTPLVNAIDFKVSILHLFTLLMQFLMPCYFFLGKPHFLRCMSLPISICIFNTITISIVLVKSQKLLQAFQSKIKLNRKETRKTIVKQAITVTINILIAMSILTVSLNGRLVNIDSKRLPKSIEKLLVCNTHLHSSILLGFQICLQIACLVPAYRGRKLPNVFNEAMTVVYACFTMTITLVVMFPIQFFQKDLRDEQLVVWVALIFNGCEQFMFMYGKKLYILIFQPKKNTKEYFQKQTFNSIKTSASKKIAT